MPNPKSKTSKTEQKPDRAARKAATLHKLAAKRMTKLLKQIRLIGNLSSYNPTLEQREAIFSAIETAVNEAEARFNVSKGGDEQPAGFSLPS